MLGSNFVKFLLPILKLQVDSSTNFVSLFSFMKDYSSLFFLAQIIYTLLKRTSLKWKFLRLLRARVKCCQIPYANFQTTSRFLSKFCIPFQFHERLFLSTFLAQTIYTLLKMSSLNWNFWDFRVLGSNFVQFLMPILKRQIPLSILYPFSVSWAITPLYFFSSSNIYFAQRKLIKMKFLRLSSARVNFCQISYANFETKNWFLCKFFITLQFHERLYLSTFLSELIYTFLKKYILIQYILINTCLIYFWDFWVLRSNFVKFLMPILKRQIDSSPNFVSLFSFMRDNSSMLF